MSAALALTFTALAIAGHLLIVRTVLNRTYEMGLPQRVWNLLFFVHLAVAIAGAVVVARIADSPWPAMHRAGVAYLAACYLALAVGAVVLALRQRHDAVVAAAFPARVKRLDARAALGRTPAGVTPLARAARAMPGNEIFTIEFVEREIRLPRLPAALDGLTILHLSDLHLNGNPDRSFFEWACDRCLQRRPDLVALTGDVVDHLGVVDWLPTTLGPFVGQAPLGCYFVLGNHDLHVAGDAIRAAMQRIGWTSLAGRAVAREVRGHSVLLAGTEVPWAGVDPPLAEAPAAALRVLLSHAPHRVDFARRHAVDLMLAGHLHGGQVRWPLLGPVNGGRFHGGLFDVPPTLLHVSRGLGQMTPYRWRCSPEATTLILRAG